MACIHVEKVLVILNQRMTHRELDELAAPFHPDSVTGVLVEASHLIEDPNKAADMIVQVLTDGRMVGDLIDKARTSGKEEDALAVKMAIESLMTTPPSSTAH